MGGRLSRFASEWTKISNNDFVINTINLGYKIHFHTPPPVTTKPAAILPFSQEQTLLIDKSIQDLLDKAAVELVSPEEVHNCPGFYSSMFVIPKKNGGIRPVFNLKNLNQYLDAPHFKMETIREVSNMINRNDYLTSIDLSDAFLHIPLHIDSRRYLRFKWKSQVYQYSTTAFGLSSVPYVFSKICRPILNWARSQGIKLSAYLDDWILAAPTKQLAAQQSQLVVNQLRQLGWKINLDKSILTPSRNIEHLGFRLNTTTMTASLPTAKLRDLRRSIKQVLQQPTKQTPRKIHSLAMRIQAATFAIFPARLYTRHLLYYKNQMVKSTADWDKVLPLDQPSIEELKWWYDNLNKWNGRSILPTTPSATVYVDASNTGWGCHWKNQRAHGYWTHEESLQSINWRELKAAHLALQSFPTLKNTTILIRTDNTTSLSYINKQGETRSLPLLNLATEVWNWCLANNIIIQAQHVPGVENTIADVESRRTFFKNQWQIRPQVFKQLNQLWGPHSVDLFADRTTKLLPRYVSWLKDPHAIHTDAFSCPWTTWGNLFINPPWNLISRVLSKLINEEIPQVTMVVPYWPSAIWFPLITKMATQPPLFLQAQDIQTTSPMTKHPLQNNWMLSVWRLSGIN